MQCFPSAAAELLLDVKADVKASTPCGYSVFNYMGCHNAHLIERLVDLGADVNQPDAYGWTPTMHACSRGSISLVKGFIAVGADLNARDIGGVNAFKSAVVTNNGEILELLLLQPSLDTYTRNLFLFAALYAHVQVLGILKDHWLAGIDLEMQSRRGKVLEIAQRRRDQDKEVSLKLSQMPLQDPDRWYAAFVDMIDTIQKRHAEKLEEDHEMWEDAKEQVE